MLPGRVRRQMRAWRRLKYRAIGTATGCRLRLQATPLGNALSRHRYAALISFLEARSSPAHVLWSKQRILSLRCGDELIRYAEAPKGIALLEREYGSWRCMRQLGLDHIAPRAMRLIPLDQGVVLTTGLLQPIRPKTAQSWWALEQVIAPLVERCERATPTLPPTVEKGMVLVRHLTGGRLPAWFGPEEAIRACFAQPLRVGFFHGDLHPGNVMRGPEGRPVLIDLKSCGTGRIAALDLLRFVIGRYPDDLVTNSLSRIVRAQATGWDMPEIQPFLRHIDLPRQLWGPIYLLHFLGSVTRKPARRFVRARDPRSNPLLSGLLARFMAAG